jgi:hypothetical protein
VDPAVQAARISRRGTFVTAAATIVAAFVGGIFAAYKVGSDQGAAAAAPSTVTVVETVTGPVPGTSSPSDEALPVNDVSAQVQLDSGTGVDVDEAEPRAVETSGPNEGIDLYYDDGGLSVNRAGLFYYSGTESDAEVGCPKAVAQDSPAPIPTVMAPGGQFCLRTSTGAVGWISCNDIEITSDRTGYIVLNYRLFG